MQSEFKEFKNASALDKTENQIQLNKLTRKLRHAEFNEVSEFNFTNINKDLFLLMTNITVVGLGYVGLANAVLLAQNNNVTAIDVDAGRVRLLNDHKSPIKDALISQYLASSLLNLRATTDKDAAYAKADYVVVCAPTNYDPDTNAFDTSVVDGIIADALEKSPNCTIVIRSTVPIGYTEKLSATLGFDKLLFSPEFLREGQALYDNLHPSRIVVGGPLEPSKAFAALLQEGATKTEIETLLTTATEAEAIKLFANSYLAMRVAYFNELDSFAISHGLNSKNIITGVGLDPRIGQSYNNPSFGYGGYCLPKDTRQLLATFGDIPQNLIEAIVTSNNTRIDFIADQIIARSPQTVGVYGLAMKTGSDNFRKSTVVSVMEKIQANGISVIVYEPMIAEQSFAGAPVLDDLIAFKEASDIIVANRLHHDLHDVAEKVFTRDQFGKD